MKPGFFISLLLHSTAVFGGIFLFSGKIMPTVEGRVIPVEMITVAELTNIRAAVKAKKPEDIKVPDDPMALETPMENAPEVAPEEVTAETPAPEPPKEKTPEKKVVETPEELPTEPEPEVVEKPADTAEAIPEPPKDKPDEKPQKPEPPAFSLDALDALVDKSRQTQPEANQQMALVSETNRYEFAESARAGSGAQDDLTLSELDALQSKMYKCWRMSVDAKNPEDLVVQVRVKLSVDGQVQDAKLTDRAGIYASGDPYLKVAAERALRAVSKCAPYDFLPADKYDTWKDLTLNFRPEA